ncbi:MAG: serine hydrolase [Pedosphaera sp. Tous-C6FEB]|nr:MAG: serine hydrolase [Pedosphaera sp. Tous-C6FEB]
MRWRLPPSLSRGMVGLRIMKALTAVFLAVALAMSEGGSALAETVYTPYPFQPAADYLRNCNGHALLVQRRGQILFEGYFNGHRRDDPHWLASGSKSFVGVLAVMAVEDGLLKLDEKLADTLREWRTDARKSQITVRQLLTLTSGLAGGESGDVPSYQEAVRGAEAKFPPGEKFQYGAVPFQCFGEFLRRKLQPRKETVEGYLKRRLLDPIGLKPSSWRKDMDGQPHLSSGAWLTAREWARFGQFVLHRGVQDDKRLVAEELLAECFHGTAAHPSYGLTFWLNAADERPRDLVMAAGAGKQKLYIVPSLQLVVVQFAEAPRRFQEREFMRLILDGLARVPAAPLELKPLSQEQSILAK